jgi:Zn-dependent peptidase ImmA (M78 family)
MKLPIRSKYPKEVTIGEATYKIRFVSTIQKDNNTLGLCDTSDYVIYIKRGLTPSETIYTFIHEVLHAIEAEYDVDLAHKHIYALERGIGDFFMTNF